MLLRFLSALAVAYDPNMTQFSVQEAIHWLIEAHGCAGVLPQPGTSTPVELTEQSP